MASNTTFAALPTATALSGSEIFPLDQGGTTKQATVNQLAKFSLQTSTASLVVNGSITAESTTAPPAGGTAQLGYLLGNSSNFGIFYGSGAPTLSAVQGSLYLRTDGTSSNSRSYIASSLGWVAVITSS